MFGNLTLTSAGGYDFFVVKMDQKGKVIWAVSNGGKYDDHATDISGISKSGVYLTGSLKGTSTFGKYTITSKTQDMFVTRVDYLGRFIWAITGGGPGADTGLAVAQVVKEAYVLGRFQRSAAMGNHKLAGKGSNDLFVARLNLKNLDGGIFNANTFMWALPLVDSGGDNSGRIAAGGDGRATLLATMDGDVQFAGKQFKGKGKGDLLHARLNDDGTLYSYQWTGGSGDDIGTAIVKDFGKDEMIAAGHFRSPQLPLGSTALKSSGSDKLWVAGIDYKGFYNNARSDGAGGAVRVNAIGRYGHWLGVAESFTGRPTLGGVKLDKSTGTDAYLALFSW